MEIKKILELSDFEMGDSIINSLIIETYFIDNKVINKLVFFFEFLLSRVILKLLIEYLGISNQVMIIPS